MESCEKSDVARVVIINKKSPHLGAKLLAQEPLALSLSWYPLSLLAGDFWFGKGEIK